MNRARERRTRPRSFRAHAAPVLATAGLAVAVGVLTVVRSAAAAAVVAGLAVLALLAATRQAVARPAHEGEPTRWLRWAWAFVLVQPIGHFSTGRTALTAVSGTPSVENVITLGGYGVIAALALATLHRTRVSVRPIWPVLLLPVYALLSTAWSLAPTVTLGFSFELVATAFLAMATTAAWRARPGASKSPLSETLRLTVQCTAVLCVTGLVDRSGWMLQGERPRFTWPGTHPLVAGAVVGLAALVLLFARPDEIGFRRAPRTGLLVLFGVCLYLGQARTALAGLLAAVLFGYWFITGGRGWARRLAGAAAIALVAVLLISTFGGPIGDYLSRGQSQSQVFSLNGRIGLWTLTLDQLHSSGRWMAGYGLSGSRVLLASSVAWAGDAHSAWLEVLLSLGLVGAAVCFAVVLRVGFDVIVASRRAGQVSRALPVLFVFSLAMSPAGAGFALPGPEPGVGFSVLGLCYAAAALRRGAPAHAGAALAKGRDVVPVPV